MGKVRRPDEVATIDAALIVMTSEETGKSIGITSETEVATEVQLETTDANKLTIKGNLKAQKPEKKTITGVKLTLTDNLTVLEVAKAVQGGEILRDPSGKIMKYTPPIVGAEQKAEKYTLEVYTACMDTSGDTYAYEKTTYKHCTGEPVAYNAKDEEWRTAEYVMNSMPKKGEPPYEIEYVDELPELVEDEVTEPALGTLTVTSTEGINAGDTSVTVTPALTSGNSYKYKTAANPTLPTYGQVCSSGYTNWDGAAEITATTGQKIVVVEVNASNEAQAAGITEVTAKA